MALKRFWRSFRGWVCVLEDGMSSLTLYVLLLEEVKMNFES